MLQAQLLSRFERRLRRMELPVNVEFWNGKQVSLGDFPKVKLVLRHPAALKALARPGLGKIGRAYVEGDIDIDCDIRGLVEFAESLCGPQQVDLKQHDSDDWKWWWHTRLFDRRAINYHYDVSNEFFALWLDRQRVYSCAYFRQPDDSLDLAQQQKIDHICRKLQPAGRRAPARHRLRVGRADPARRGTIRRLRDRDYVERAAICARAGANQGARPRRALRSAPA